jgi:esterase/lipase superfamily enzyme
MVSGRRARRRTGPAARGGALAMLHAHCRHPGIFDALFLQSGSFFCPRFDSQERGFPYYQRIVQFVAGVHAGRLLPGRTIPVVLTCGAIEENIENNRLMTRDGDHLDWLRGRISLLLVCGQGQWEDTTGSLDSTRRFAGLLDSKGIRHELDLWGHDVPHDWPSWRAQMAHHMPRFC